MRVIPKPAATVISSIGDISDVIITNPQDDHILQYDATTQIWVNVLNSGGSGVADHGALTGLGDDDHLQYHTDARGDARYYTQAQVDALVGAGGDSTSALTFYPFDISNATGHDWDGSGNHNVSIEYEWDRDATDFYVRAEINANSNWDEAVWSFHLPDNFAEFNYDLGDPFSITVYTTDATAATAELDIYIDGASLVSNLDITPLASSAWETVTFDEDGAAVGPEAGGARIIIVIKFSGTSIGAGNSVRVKNLMMKYKA